MLIVDPSKVIRVLALGLVLTVPSLIVDAQRRKPKPKPPTNPAQTDATKPPGSEQNQNPTAPPGTQQTSPQAPPGTQTAQPDATNPNTVTTPNQEPRPIAISDCVS